MATKIHSTAFVDPKAQLGEGVEIGPYSIVGPHVRIGKGTRVQSHVVFSGYTEMGENCTVYTGACIGGDPQVRKVPLKSYLKIGNENTIREYVTLHPGMYEESSTIIGDKNFIMIQAHVAHDCQLGSEITIANNVGIAGHVTIEDKVVIGGLAGIHQFVRLGKFSMVGGVSKVVMDVPPFATCDGHPAKFYGINTVGLRRAGYTAEQMRMIRKALKDLLASGKKLSESVKELQRSSGQHPEIQTILKFLESSKRGVIRADRGKVEEESD